LKSCCQKKFRQSSIIIFGKKGIGGSLKVINIIFSLSFTLFCSQSFAENLTVDSSAVQQYLSVRNCSYPIYGRNKVNKEALDCIVENLTARKTSYGEFRYKVFDANGIKINSLNIESLSPNEPDKSQVFSKRN
jgi:hypothetical protein